MLITSVSGEPTIQPFVPEFEDDVEFLTDTAAIQSAIPGLVVLDRTVEWPAGLNAIAIQDWLSFSGFGQPIIGLGSFDPPSDESDWELLFST